MVQDEPIDFETWYVAAHPRVLAALVLTTGDVDRASDATDEAFVRCYSKWNRVSAMESPIAWTIRVAINVARRRTRRASLENRLLGRLPIRGNVPAAAGEAWYVVGELPDRQREVIVLRYVADLTQRDIATALGVSRSAVSSALTDAHRNLSNRLTDTDPNQPPQTSPGGAGQTKPHELSQKQPTTRPSPSARRLCPKGSP